MYVINRKGIRQPVRFDRITDRIIKLATDLNVDVPRITQKIARDIYEGVTTSDIDRLASVASNELITTHPDYAKLAARIAVDNLSHDTPNTYTHSLNVLRFYSWDVVDPAAGGGPTAAGSDEAGDPLVTVAPPSPADWCACKTNDSGLVNDDVYKFVLENAEVLNKEVANASIDLDFFGFRTLESKYLLRVNGRIAERVTYRLMTVAVQFYMKIGLDMVLKTFRLACAKYNSFATPALMNGGTKRSANNASCFLLTVDDSLEGILKCHNNCAYISKKSGGIGISVSAIRAEGSYIRGTNGTGKGIPGMLQMFNAMVGYIDQGGGRRKGSAAIYVEPWHADIISVVEMKKEVTDSKTQQAKDLFYALWTPDLYMRRVEEDGDWSLMCPDTAKDLVSAEIAPCDEYPEGRPAVYRGLFDVHSAEFEEMYLRFESQPAKYVLKTIKARDLWKRLLQTQMETGAFYMLYKDAANRKSNQQNLGTIRSSNLCVKGDTRILTERGQLEIATLKDQELRVWNGAEWSTVTVRQTGENQELVRVSMDNNTYLDCTPYHKFYNDKGVEIRACDLVADTKLQKAADWPVINAGTDLEYAYTHGLFCADGTYSNTSLRGGAEAHRCTFKSVEGGLCVRHQAFTINTNNPDDGTCRAMVELRPLLHLYGEKRALIQYLEVPVDKMVLNDQPDQDRISVFLPNTLTQKYKVPVNASLQSRLRWFEGYCDGDGCVLTNGTAKTIQCCSTELYFLRDIRAMLQTMGINPNLKLAKLQRVTNIKGIDYNCRPTYRLLISAMDTYKLTVIGFAPKRMVIGYCPQPQRAAAVFTKILSVTPLADRHNTYCFTEPLKGKGVFGGVLTGQCAEVVQYTAPDEIACCNLMSLPLPSFVVPDATHGTAFAWDGFTEAVRHAIITQNRMIDTSQYPVPATKVSNLKHRPIGLGVQGLADVFQIMEMPYESDEARLLNKLIHERMLYDGLTESCVQAQIHGTYSSFAGSPASKGILQFDMWGVTPAAWPERYAAWQPDWVGLKADIIKHGLRNSLITALMPTATTAQILGNCESFEPYTYNIYNRRVLSGEFTVVNPNLVRALEKIGKWNATIKDEIILANGSVQQLDIPQRIKDIYKTVWEMSQKTLLTMSAERGAYIDQSQSLNIYLQVPEAKTPEERKEVANLVYGRLTSLHFHGWRLGLKTGMYYLRTNAAGQALQVTVKKTETSPTGIGGPTGECRLIRNANGNFEVDPSCEGCNA